MTDSVAATAEDYSNQREFLGHPVGLYVCFTTELWERFSFYGMKYLLLLYLTKYHLFTDEMGFDVLGSYAGLVYALPLIGGIIADRCDRFDPFSSENVQAARYSSPRIGRRGYGLRLVHQILDDFRHRSLRDGNIYLFSKELKP